MFTGLVDHCGTIADIQHHANTLSLWIDCGFVDLVQGESISVDGVCLTVTEQQAKRFRCDVSSETCRVTMVNDYTIGQAVNLERALRAADRLGGHFVTGHIDQVARIATQDNEAEFTRLRFAGIEQRAANKYLLHKGCVAVNGVSLTINEVHADGFSVMLIPHTLHTTNLKALKDNDAVNIEFDWMVKMVAQQLENIQGLRAIPTQH